MANQDKQAGASEEGGKVSKQGKNRVTHLWDKKARKLLVAFVLLALGALGASFLVALKSGRELPFSPPSLVSPEVGFEKFASEEEFKSYLEAAAEAPTALSGGLELMPVPEMVGDRRAFLETPSEAARPAELGKGVPERVSETTVQVKGIDEPDIVKTDGEEIYYSLQPPVYRSQPEPFQEGEKRGSTLAYGETKAIKAFPPARLAEDGIIDKKGDLLLAEDVLVILTEDNQVYGYDVSRPQSPVQEWKVDLESNTVLVGARLYRNKVYLVTRKTINADKPCPITPLSVGGKEFSVRCTDVYHPTVDVPVDVTYTAFILNPRTGMVEKSVSFVGSSGLSILYMSPNALFATYTYYGDPVDFFCGFFLKEGEDLVPGPVMKRLKVLQNYDLSSRAKMLEFQTILEGYFSSLDDNERLRIENEFTSKMEDYSKKYSRGLEKTGLVKISLDNFKILATGNVPGRPLNQFSLDEYQGYLRMATTVEGGTFGTGESANDVYILDGWLRQVGSVTDLGLDERIYSARFIDDKGYLVTFKETDPFFVLDLSNPRHPEVKGKLKIPGYSSYLHPISKDEILGIGKEGSQVKISLFDVSSPENPTEVSKYLLDEFWSDILNTHHAFLLDKDHRVFFLPGSRGGYIFSYRGDELELVKAVAGIQARRALYINDYLYIVGDNKLVVLNEIDWEEINELEF